METKGKPTILKVLAFGDMPFLQYIDIAWKATRTGSEVDKYAKR